MSSTETSTLLRAPGKNERRCIMRHALGYYRALIISGLYIQDSEDASSKKIGIETFIPALKQCIEAHPILSAAISGEATEAPQFVRPATLDLRNHIQICDVPVVERSTQSELDLLKSVTVKTHDQLFANIESVPPWKIVILPLSAEPGSSKQRFYVLFALSHSHGDGKSGLAFHKTFLGGLEAAHLVYDDNPIHQPSTSSLLPPLEDACNLEITWPYLLGPFFGTYLPKFISSFLNLHASSTPRLPNTWLGKPTSYDPSDFRTGLEILVIDGKTLNGVLAACKAHGAKLTGLLHQVIVRVLSDALPADTPAEAFVGGTAIDLRRLAPTFTDDDMAVCVTGLYEAFPRNDGTSDNQLEETIDDNEAMWAAARKTTGLLAAAASTLVNQPIGLLRYLGHFRMWLVNQIGKERDISYEISNILTFDPFATGENRDVNSATGSVPQVKNWDIRTALFSQPANAVDGPIRFQVVSRKGGAMVITVTWQRGVLGVADEDEFVNGLRDGIRNLISKIASETM